MKQTEKQPAQLRGGLEPRAPFQKRIKNRKVDAQRVKAK